MRIKAKGTPGLLRKLDKLLDMEYTPAEIEEETGLDRKYVWRLVTEKGLPARKSSNNRFWIHGLTFADWIRGNDIPKKIKMEPNEYYCLPCHKRIVPLPETVTIVQEPTFRMWRAACPICNREVRKYHRKTTNDKP